MLCQFYAFYGLIANVFMFIPISCEGGFKLWIKTNETNLYQNYKLVNINFTNVINVNIPANANLDIQISVMKYTGTGGSWNFSN